jgi:2-amino-4-hydroxy-6-hydroxymethyldihydropteridine diphosphokinase
MKPLAELAPDWRHPLLKKTAAELAKAIPEGDIVEPLKG